MRSLVRRKVLRRDDSYLDDSGQELLNVFCPRRNERMELLVAEPDTEQAGQLQQRMIDLLYGDGDISG